MPVEINYLGWGDEDGTGDLFDSIHQYPANRLHIKSGHLVCSLIHTRGWYPSVSYEFLASDKDQPISKLCRIVFNRRHTYEYWGIYDWQIFDITPDLASKLQAVISKVPKFPGGMTQIMIPSEQSSYYSGILFIDTQPNVFFSHNWGGANYAFGNIEDGKQFADCILELIRLGDAIANNTLQYRDYVEATFEPFRHLIRNQIVREKYQINWSRPTSWNSPKWEDRDNGMYSHYEVLTSFLDVNLRDDLERQLDFKFYLPDFMRLISLHNSFASSVVDFFQKIAETDFPRWDADEQSAFHNYLGALIDYILVYFPSISMDILTFIRGVQTIDADVPRYVNH